MNLLAAAVVCLLSIVVLCALSTFAGRRRTTRTHSIAFYAGLVGLLAVPAWLVALREISFRIPYLTLAGPAGALFVVSGIAMFCASLLSLLALLSFRTGTRSAA
jgi:hypothetical protein